MTQTEKYFTAEKTESVLFLLIGLAALIIASYYLIKIKQPFFNGLSYSIIMVALIQLAVGSSVYLRSFKDLQRVDNFLLQEISKIKTAEIPRMEAVMKNFVIYRWVEFFLIIIGLLFYFYFPVYNVWKGVGLGLIIQSSLMLGLDYFAESRGKIYMDYLQLFTN
jgi:hypothetical protein